MAGRPNQTMGPAEWTLLVTLAAIALQVALRLSGARLPRDARAWSAFLVMGALANVIPFALIIWGQTRIESGLAAILNVTTPLFTILAARAMTRSEPLTAAGLAGVLAGLGGAIVVLGPETLLDLGGNAGRTVAQVAVLVAALSYALSSLYGRRFRGLSPLVPAAGQVTGATVLLLPLSLIVDRPWTMGAPSADSVGAVIGLAVLCSAVAAVLFFRLLAAAGPMNLGLVTYLIPVGALLLGTALLDERLEPRQLAGMAVIFAGLATIDGRLPAAIRRWWGARSTLARRRQTTQPAG